MVRHNLVAAVTFASSAWLAACGGTPDDTPTTVPGPFDEIVSPAGLGSETPHLAAGAGGAILSWLEPTGPDSDETYSLRFSRLAGDGWTEPRTVIDRSDLFVNWADFPSVVELASGQLAAHWLQYNGPGTYAYQVRLAFSSDGGMTWSNPVIPHETETQTEHGFVSLAPAGDGIDVVWLDGRDYAEHPDDGVMSLRHARVASTGAIGPETVLDARTCDCCQTSVAAIPGGSIVAYRGRTAAEIRDIQIVRRVDGAWEPPAVVHADGWHIPACPVNGPEIAATGSHVRVSWFTAAADSGRVYAAMSHDAGATFGTPVRIDDGRPIGRVGTLALSGGRTLVSWLEAVGDGEGAEVRARMIGADGRASASVPIGTSSVARASGFPVLALAGDRIIVAWTDPDQNRVRVAVGRAAE